MKKFPLLMLTLTITLLVGGLMVSKTAAAQSIEASPSQVRVTPVEINLSLKPGQVYNGKFQISNNGTETYDFRITANRFFVTDLTYETIYDRELATTQIAKWVSFDETEFHGLQPGQKHEINYQIKVPKDAPGGGQYAVLFATVSSKTSSGGYDITTNSRIGVKIYAQVAGETHVDGRVESVSQTKFYQKGPISSTARVKNTGNVDFESTHEYVIKSITGHELYQGSITKRIMPGTTREIELKWWDEETNRDKTPALGIFKVRNKVSFLGKVQYDKEKIIIVAPIWFVVVLIIAFILILGLIVLLILFIVKKKRHQEILKQHKSAHSDE